MVPFLSDQRLSVIIELTHCHLQLNRVKTEAASVQQTKRCLCDTISCRLYVSGMKHTLVYIRLSKPRQMWYLWFGTGCRNA